MKKQAAALIILMSLMAPLSALSQAESKDDELFKKAMSYFFQKKFEMAEIMLQSVIKKDPENALAYSYLGDIFLIKKRYDGALTLYSRALDIKPGSAENYFRLGQIYYYKRMGEPAIENFQKALEMDSKLKFSYYHIGLTYLMLQRDKQNTIKNWETYITKAPEDPQYESIRRAIELLRDPNFVIPPEGSEISIQEALLLGGATLKKPDRQATDKKAGHADKKTKKKIEGIYLDDDL